MGRYKIIKTGENILRMNACPIYAEKYHILLDTKTNTNVLQIKFKNTNSKNIKSIFLNIDCFDDSKDFLCTLDDVAYVGLNIKKRQTFGDKQAINTNKNIIGNIKIKVLKVVFTDESVWRNESDKYLEEIPKPTDAKQHFGVFYNQYVRECRKSHINYNYAYTDYDNFWQCSCGQPNDKDSEICFNCNKEKEVLEKVSNINYLEDEDIKFQEAEKQRLIAEQQQEKQRLIAEEQEKKIAEEENKKQKIIKRKQRNKKIFKICSVLIIFLGVYALCSFVYKTYQYDKAIQYMENGKNSEAVNIFYKIGDFKNLQNKVFNISTIANSMAVKRNGTIISTDDDPTSDIYKWRNIVGISSGYNHTVGLKKNGKVVITGSYFYQEDVDDWENIVDISAGGDHTVGLKKDGSVLAMGDNSEGQCDVDDWKDIITVCAGDYHTVGLKEDNTVVAIGKNLYDQCNVDDWKDIVAISAGKNHTVGLKSDGTVVAVGDSFFGQCNVDDWKDIVAIYAGENRTIGLKADGTVVTCGCSHSKPGIVDSWKDIVAIYVGDKHTVGLKSDGTVVAAGDNSYGQCDVDDWKNVKVCK